ncbi:hypothetical protein LPJ53_006507, partial [Coemansia erecta]
PPTSIHVPVAPRSGPKTTPHKTRTGTSGSIQSRGLSEAQRDELQKQNAKGIAEKYAHRDISEVLRVARPTADKGTAAVAASEDIADMLERLLVEDVLPYNSGLSKTELLPLVDGISEWTRVATSVSTEKPLYDYFASFVLFVAHCLKSMADSDGLNVARLVLPSLKADF